LINNEATDFVLIEEQKQQVERNQFSVTCKLDLDEADGSVYVNKWNYTVFFDGQLPKRACAINIRDGRKVCGTPVHKTSFGVSPD
jgi:hypothetical protein